MRRMTEVSTYAVCYMRTDPFREIRCPRDSTETNAKNIEGVEVSLPYKYIDPFRDFYSVRYSTKAGS